jgi:hypothetical protein
LDPLLTLDDLLADEVMAPVLRSAGYEPDEFLARDVKVAFFVGQLVASIGIIHLKLAFGKLGVVVTNA